HSRIPDVLDYVDYAPPTRRPPIVRFSVLVAAVVAVAISAILISMALTGAHVQTKRVMLRQGVRLPAATQTNAASR
ncbi:MAG TPA: hypothetical protein VH518_10845, partial [Tepidisphaeraceae bacterium]